jgi:hypothetical protein
MGNELKHALLHEVTHGAEKAFDPAPYARYDLRFCAFQPLARMSLNGTGLLCSVTQARSISKVRRIARSWAGSGLFVAARVEKDLALVAYPMDGFDRSLPRRRWSRLTFPCNEAELAVHRRRIWHATQLRNVCVGGQLGDRPYLHGEARRSS